MRYPVNLDPDPDSGGYVVSFPDIPEALSQGDTREEALGMALDALVTAFEFYFEDNQKIPLPSDMGLERVALPLSISAKVILLNEFIDSGITQTELANRMGVKKQEVTRLFDLRHSTKIDRIQDAMKALHKKLNLVLVRD